MITTKEFNEIQRLFIEQEIDVKNQRPDINLGIRVCEKAFYQWYLDRKEKHKKLNVLKVVLDDGAYKPTRAHKDDAGLDIYTPDDVFIPAKDSVIIDTGVHVAIPKGYVGMLKSKSGLNVKMGLVSEGVIDSGYTGAIKVKLYNHSDEDAALMAGNKVSQLVIQRIITPEVQIVDSLEETERGDSGFGSTGA